MVGLRNSDLLRPVLPDTPPQWQEVPAELAARLRPARGFLLPEEARLLDRILAADWLLLKNTHGFRCGRCSAVHAYLTAMCQERPFNRLSAIWGLIQERPDDERDLLISGIGLGTIEPISEAEARKLAWKIRFRGGRLAEWKEAQL